MQELAFNMLLSAQDDVVVDTYHIGRRFLVQS